MATYIPFIKCTILWCSCNQILELIYVSSSLRSILTQIERHACVFTFGYGSEHDTDLLHALASAGNGLFYYIDNKDSIPESFCDCLGGLLSVAAQVGNYPTPPPHLFLLSLKEI